jgi:glycosyltransferase involved in cell wall biosynthesis
MARVTLIRSPPETERKRTGLGAYSDSVEDGLRSKGTEFGRILVGKGIGTSEKNVFKRIWFNIIRPMRDCAASGWDGVFHATDEFCSICFPFLGGRKVMTFHHYQGDDTRTFFLAAWKIVVRIGVRLSDRIIAVSPKSKKDLMEHYGVPEEKIVLIMNRVDDRFKTLGIPRTREIGYVGTLTQRKNVDAAIRAFHKLIRMPGTEDVRMRICGRGPMLGELERLADELGVRDRVSFVAGISDDELVEMYNSIQVLANPSMLEGFGLTTLEAQRCSAPVVCFRDADIPEETVRHAVPSADTDEFAENMHRLIVDAEFREKVVLEGKAYADGFGGDHTEKLTEVYDSLS